MTTRGAARALLVLLVLVAALAGVGPSAPAARAQTPTVGLTLLAQTPWTETDDPATRTVESELRVAVVATNRGQARLGELDVTIALGSSILSRSEYEAAVSGTPFTATSTATVPFDGHLEPGTARTFTVGVDMATLPGVSLEDSRVYPMDVALRSRGNTVGSLTSAAIHLVRVPEQPIRLAWWTEMATPVAFDARGELVDPDLEAAVRPEGSLGAQAGALATLTDGRGRQAPIDLVIEPALLVQLERMAAGYRRADGTEVPPGQGPAADAAALLERLRAVAATSRIQVSASPFAGPSLPAMLGSGLGAELARQRDAGSRTLARVLAIDPTEAVARPPGGFLDDAALERLVTWGAAAVLADDDEVERPAVGELEFAPLATARVPTATGEATLVLPDPSTQRLFGRTDLLADPVRASQLVLGQLAVIWKEAPIPVPQPDGTPTVRGVAIAPPAELPTTMWEPLLQRIANAPFLAPAHAQAFAQDVTPPAETSVLRAPDTLGFSVDYATEVVRLRRDATAYASMLVEASPVPQRLRTDLLFATSREYLIPNEPAGRPWLDAVSAVTGPAFAGATPRVEQVFTFTSREGTIPLVMGDPGPDPLRVIVQLESSQFEFPSGDRQEVVLERPDQIVSFDVVAKAAGRNPIQVRVLSPAGAEINRQTIAVASTAVNRIALLVTLAAAGGLVVLYARRRVRRRKADAA
jgi:hypothetical protein